MKLAEYIVQKLKDSLSNAEKNLSAAKAEMDAAEVELDTAEELASKAAGTGTGEYDKLRLAAAGAKGALKHYTENYNYRLGWKHGMEIALILAESLVKAERKLDEEVDVWEAIA
ncbi:MAG: hypothetical protein IJQ82_02285 [Selenomonadaceae bacterium]|nr:hypothetical protein [Selenomonadaceae bacterium]